LFCSVGADGFLNLLHGSIKFFSPGVRMSALALLGDLAKYAPSTIAAGFGELVTVAITCATDFKNPMACNNALWSIGEMCKKCQGSEGGRSTVEPYAERLVGVLKAFILGGTNTNGLVFPNGILENASVTLGRLAAVDPRYLSNVVEKEGFVGLWSVGLLKNIGDVWEKADGYNGLLACLGGGRLGAVLNGDNCGPSNVSGLLIAISGWHVCPNYKEGGEGDEGGGLSECTIAVLHSVNYMFREFPVSIGGGGEVPVLVELRGNLRSLVLEVMKLCGEVEWAKLKNRLPKNVLRLLEEQYPVI